MGLSMCGDGADAGLRLSLLPEMTPVAEQRCFESLLRAPFWVGGREMEMSSEELNVLGIAVLW